MTVAIIIDILVIAVLVSVTITKGFERALPYFVFVTVLLPVQAKIVIFDIFALSGQRVAIVTLVALYLIFKKQGAQVSPLETTPLKFLLMLHIAWCLLSTANSIVPGDSFKKLLYEVFEYYAMYYIFIKTITQVKTIHRIMGAVVCAVFVACVFGAIEAYSGWRV